MLIPKKVKHRKWNKGRSRGRVKDSRGTNISFGKYALAAAEPAWVKTNQIESARRAIIRLLSKTGKLWIRVVTDKPVTKKPPEVTLGMGKGSVEYYVTVVKPGRIIFELDGVSEVTAREAFRLATSKLPMKTKIIINK
ncbi:MAG: 50S ribosomal protein L16 [Candidatus Parcubacteria bacterium]|jgi:large subunit ribosomal protein L16|nr:50S ribosomal protein L16 [Candidatus Parcubacteria bacterium]